MTLEEKKTEYQAVWTQSYVDNYQHLRSYALLLAKNHHVAEDIVQDTFIKILSLLPNPEEIEDKLNYLRRSVHNTWVDWWKRTNQLKTISIDDPHTREVYALAAPERGDSIEAETEAHRLMLQIELRRLNLRERAVLVKYLEGYKRNEIAAQLNEDARVISYELNAVRAKVRYRLNKLFKEGKTKSIVSRR